MKSTRPLKHGQNLLGLVLSGGESSRMGSDKGLLLHGDKTWVQLAVEKLQTLEIPVRVSVNARQSASYRNLIAASDLVEDNRTLEIGGPLLGVLSAYLTQSGTDLFVLACDLPLISPEIVKGLYNHYLEEPGYEVYLYTQDGEQEPLCGIYTAAGLDKVLELYRTNLLIRHSMKFVLGKLNVHAQMLTEEQKHLFRNFNSPSSLHGL